MSTNRAFGLLLSASLVSLAGPAGRVDEIAFHPGEGARLIKRFQEASRWELESAQTMRDGVELEVAAQASAEIERSLIFEDTWGDLADGQLKNLDRRFPSLTSQMRLSVDDAGTLTEYPARAASDLEGLSVRFEWDADQGAHSVRFAPGSEGPSVLLERLEVDADLRGFLPTKPVNPEDTWDVELRALAKLLRPGGELHLAPREASGGSLSTIPAQFLIAAAFTNLSDSIDEIEGKVRAQFLGIRVLGGRSVAELELEVDAQASRDLSEAYQGCLESIEDADAVGAKLTVKSDFAGSGTVLWDLEAGRVASASLDLEITLDVVCSFGLEVSEDPMDFDGKYEVRGTSEVRLTTEE